MLFFCHWLRFILVFKSFAVSRAGVCNREHNLLLISREIRALGLGLELLSTITGSVLCWLSISLLSFIQAEGNFIQCFLNEIGLY